MTTRCLILAASLLVLSINRSSPAAEDFLAWSSGGGTPVWGVADQSCSDGKTTPFLSSAIRGEQPTSVLRSRDFEIPNKLSFWIAGHSHGGKNTVRLVDAVTGEVIRSATPPGSDSAVQVEWELAELMGKRVRLVLEDGDAGDGFAWMTFGRLQPPVISMPASGDERPPSGWTEDDLPPENIVSQGIPFLKKELWRPGEGESTRLETGGISARMLYLLGGINSVDRANPPWGGGESYRNTFVGDEAGTVTLIYQSGAEDIVPLVYGYSIFWHDPFNHSHEPFSSDGTAFDLLNRTLCVAGAVTTGTRDWFVPVALRAEPLEAIVLSDSPHKEGFPKLEGMTFGGLSGAPSGDQKHLARITGTPDDTLLTWLQTHAVRSDDPYPAERRRDIAALGRLLYTWPDDITFQTIAATKADVTAENFAGPKLRFTGPPEAELLTRIYYENAQGMLDRIASNGMVHESAPKADYYGGFGGYRPELGAFWDAAYTRIRILTLASDMGFTDLVEKSLGFFDHWLMYFPYSYPQNQMAGKPVPGHWTVIANKPHIYFDFLKDNGWPTKFRTRDFGNPESDGHGMLMLSHWRQWLKLGRPAGWVEKNWTALNEAAEYILWAIDNPELSFSEHGLLYNETEGGMQKASMYCDMPCYLGLLAYAHMAEAAGRADQAGRWRRQAERLFDSMNSYYPVETEQWGSVWDPQKSAGWFGDHATLAPLLFGMDYWGYDAINRLPGDWADRTRCTYARQLTRNRPEWCTPAGLGYGQCYITEGALLLDRMTDAGHMADWLVRFCFHPRQKHPYRVPEGVTMATDGSVWRRWGDLGNLYQLGETVYVIRLMAGVDDVDPGELKLMPRIPVGWTGLQIREQPVRAMSGGESRMVRLDMELSRDPAGRSASVTIETDGPLDTASIRLGPFPTDAGSVRVTVNGKPLEAKLLLSGDSKWAWIPFADGVQRRFTIEAATDGR